jgi:hypothetical protein
MKRIFTATCSALALAGCAVSPQRAAMTQEVNRTIPTCEGEKDCAAKWDAAQLWVVKNAGYKLQTVTNVVIQTFNPGPSDVYLAAAITKEPAGAGKFRLIGRLWCNNPFGCSPDPLEALLRFNREVSAATP